MSDQNVTVRDFGDNHRWRKSQRSNDSGGACLYIATDDDRTGIRDSKLGNEGRAMWTTTADFQALKNNLR